MFRSARRLSATATRATDWRFESHGHRPRCVESAATEEHGRRGKEPVCKRSTVFSAARFFSATGKRGHDDRAVPRWRGYQGARLPGDGTAVDIDEAPVVSR